MIATSEHKVEREGRHVDGDAGPSTAELARDMAKLEDRWEQDRAALDRRWERDRDESRREMRDGFSDLKTAIAALRFVNPDVYLSDQRRQDEAHLVLATAVATVQDDRATDRRLVLASLLFPIVVGVILYGLVGA